jgi:hypothetical protein
LNVFKMVKSIKSHILLCVTIAYMNENMNKKEEFNPRADDDVINDTLVPQSFISDKLRESLSKENKEHKLSDSLKEIFTNSLRKSQITKGYSTGVSLTKSSSIIGSLLGPPRIDIAVVGNNRIGKTYFIKYWLSINENNIITSNVYSKIIWIKEEPVQLCIHEISSLPDLRRNKMFHAIIYMYNLENDNSRDAVPHWIEFMKHRINDLTYQVILGVSDLSNDKIELETDEVMKIRKFYANQKISYFRQSLQPSESLTELIDGITTEAYDALKKMPTINSSNYGDPNEIEMNLFDKKINQHPFLLRKTGDNTITVNTYKNYESDYKCCTII